MKLNVNNPAYVIVFAAVVSAVFTAAIMTLHAVTRPIVERNERLAMQRALVDVFALNDGRALEDEAAAVLYADHIRQVEREIVDPRTGHTFNVPPGRGDRHAHRTYKAMVSDAGGDGQRLLGYAFPIWGTGFWARIEGYLAVSGDLKTSLGVVFIRHAETPGLGGRITEREWRSQFAGLDVTAPTPPGRVIYIGGQGAGAMRQGRRVDAITGATGTSRAVETFLRRRIAEFRRAMAAGEGR